MFVILSGIVTWNYIIEPKLLVLDRNSWNHVTACKLFVLRIGTYWIVICLQRIITISYLKP